MWASGVSGGLNNHGRVSAVQWVRYERQRKCNGCYFGVGLQWLRMPVYDMDNELWHPNAARILASGKGPRVEVKSLPRRGQLYAVHSSCVGGEC